MKKYLCFLVLFPIFMIGQTQTENYVMTTVYKIPTPVSIAFPTISQATQTVSYFDGLGRPIQQVSAKQSNSEKDIITAIEYDNFGRQVKENLPYVRTGTSLSYDSSAGTGLTNFYNSTSISITGNPNFETTAYPYSGKLIEESPLNRVLKQAAPGAPWILGSGHEIKLDYQTNIVSEVKLYQATGTWNATNGLYDIALANASGAVFYPASKLYKTITTDENNNNVEEFKDNEGKVILKRAYESGAKHDTYYVYDQYGNLTYVIPPKAADLSIDQTILNNLCYQYKYDYRNRMVEKQLPGKQLEFIVYDKLDRVVATGPVFSPFTNLTTSGWMITKYDAFNRPVITAWMDSAPTAVNRKSFQDMRNNETSNFSESHNIASDLTINGVAFRYTDNVWPTNNFNILTINYYDDYNFAGATSAFTTTCTQPSTTNYNNSTKKPKGLLTGQWARIITTSTTYTGDINNKLYDYKGRIIQTRKYGFGGFDKIAVDSQLELFSGKLLYTITTHKKSVGASAIVVREDFTYSNQDRLLTQTHKIGSGTPQYLANNGYDELGQLISKKVGGTSTLLHIQKVDYNYNIRGWLLGINKTEDPSNPNYPLTDAGFNDDLFAFKINYNTVKPCTNYTGTPLFNGNISETYWRTKSDNRLRQYGYSYDQLNRLKSAIYIKPIPITTYGTSNNFNENNILYDKNGNITHLDRYGDNGENPYEPVKKIDDLIYTYASNSNLLQEVVDGTYIPAGFKDDGVYGVDFTYDTNGNMITDQNKGIIAIKYNHMNLPTSIQFSGTQNQIDYLYNALGEKLQKTVTQNGVVTSKTDYLDSFQYNGLTGALQFFPTSEGYVNNTVVNSVNTYNYVYNYTDHLGNVRLSYGLDANNILKTYEESNYYPFGMKHNGYNTNNTQPNYKYKFQGQERQDELGLNWDSFKWRNYDYAIGRFMNIDPLTEKYNTWSPYAFSGNRVIDARELEGLEPYVVTGRAFIPLKTVPSPLAPVSNTKSFKGDTRNNYDVNATSYRTEQKVRVDFDKKTATTTSNVAAPSVGFDSKGNVTATSTSEKAGPTPTYDKAALEKGNSTTVNMQVDASNGLVNGAPPINYDVNITLSPQSDGSINYQLNGNTDGFPAYEFFITNEATGNSTLMFGSNPNNSGDKPTALFPPMEKSVYGSGTLEKEKPKQ